MSSAIHVPIIAQDRASGTLVKVQNQIKQFDVRVKQASESTMAYGRSMSKASGKQSRLGQITQQAGFQFGDMAVQIGGGTSALQAFGQQGSQLLGIFGPVGAVLGAVVAIGSAVGLVYQKATRQTTDFALAADELDTAVSALNISTATSEDIGKQLQQTYGKVTDTTIAAAEAQAIYNTVLAQSKINQATVALKNFAVDIEKASTVTRMLNRESRGFAAVSTFVENLGFMFSDTLKSMADDMGITTVQLEKLGKAFTAVGNSTGEEQIKAATAALNELRMTSLLGTEQGAELAKALNSIIAGNAKLASQDLAAYIEAIRNAKGAVGELSSEQEQLAKSVSQSFGDAFKDVIKGTQSVSDAFRNMASKIIDRLIDVLVIQRMVGTVANADGTGGTGIAGSLTRRQYGGQVTRDKTYLVGEAGAELFTPTRSGHIIPNNKMGGGGVVVNQTINVSTGVSQTVRAEVAGLMPQIAAASKAAVLDAKQRGGSFSKAF